MDKKEMMMRILKLENKCNDLQHQIYRLRGKPTPTNVSPYSSRHTLWIDEHNRNL